MNISTIRKHLGNGLTETEKKYPVTELLAIKNEGKRTEKRRLFYIFDDLEHGRDVSRYLNVIVDLLNEEGFNVKLISFDDYNGLKEATSPFDDDRFNHLLRGRILFASQDIRFKIKKEIKEHLDCKWVIQIEKMHSKDIAINDRYTVAVRMVPQIIFIPQSSAFFSLESALVIAFEDLGRKQICGQLFLETDALEVIYFDHQYHKRMKLFCKTIKIPHGDWSILHYNTFLNKTINDIIVDINKKNAENIRIRNR